MNLNARDHHWMPQNMHGVIPMPTDGNVAQAIENALNELLPSHIRRSIGNVDFLIHTNVNGTKSIVFELK